MLGLYAVGKGSSMRLLCRRLGVGFAHEDLVNLPLGLIKSSALLLTAVFVSLHTL